MGIPSDPNGRGLKQQGTLETKKCAFNDQKRIINC